jgi:hypothetical protein
VADHATPTSIVRRHRPSGPPFTGVGTHQPRWQADRLPPLWFGTTQPVDVLICVSCDVQWPCGPIETARAALRDMAEEVAQMPDYRPVAQAIGHRISELGAERLESLLSRATLPS